MKPIPIFSAHDTTPHSSANTGVSDRANPKADIRGRLTVDLSRGRKLELLPATNPDDPDLISFYAPDGAIEVEIRLTDQGPVVKAQASQLQIQSARTVELDCERFAVKAAREIDLASEGDITGHCRGGLQLSADGPTNVSADSVAVRAQRGNIDLEANDDVCLVGERVFLNK